MKLKELSAKKEVRIVLDPGHGGREFGTTAGGLIEKDVNLRVMKALHAMLNGTWVGQRQLKIFATRKADATTTPEIRGLRAEDADLVISLHVNACSDPEEHGLMAFYKPGCQVSRRFAGQLQRYAPFYRRETPWKITKKNWPNVHAVMSWFDKDQPFVLVEMGFATNERDAAFLKKGSNLAEVVAGLAMAIEESLK